MKKRHLSSVPPASGVQPMGRRPNGDGHAPLKTVTFKADTELFAALAELQAALGGEIRARRSVAIRKAILAARDALHAKGSS